MKYEFVIPTQISLQGSTITIRYDNAISDQELAGLWSPNSNQITLNPVQSIAVQFETFCHELSEAINSKFVNEPEAGNTTDHRVVDAYGRGIYNFLIENAHLVIVKVEDDKLD